MTRPQAIAAAWAALEPLAATTPAAHEYITRALRTSDEKAVLAGLRRLCEIQLHDEHGDPAAIKQLALDGVLDRLGLRVEVMYGPFAGKTTTLNVGWRTWIAWRERMVDDETLGALVSYAAAAEMDLMDIKFGGDVGGRLSGARPAEKSAQVPKRTSTGKSTTLLLEGM